MASDTEAKLRADGGVDLSDANLPTIEEALRDRDGGGGAVSTEAECNGCDVTAPLSELPDGDHNFATVKAVNHTQAYITVVHVCGECGCLSATTITSEENVPKIRKARESDDNAE